ncbi:T-cell surface glycoprotein CD3 zeta chain isoform X1 [Leucoraja erinacea]|uniref:T-cell surface glycoprotein CD3 zeta chain isoform X1 n=2 Tax=Leucoraja erinaceus TaxID=7782 RepID=UPI002455EA14|nr:T-cell surface glycoprotein CD3 zeta chain isoform X1 [Leucoraja erinacea]
MQFKWICAVTCLAVNLQLSDAGTMDLNDPKLCYILDGILFIYGIIITALYLKLRLTKAKSKLEDTAANQPNTEGPYEALQKKSQETYSDLRFNKRQQDTEAATGGRRNERMNAAAASSDTYSKLNAKTRNEAYGELKPTQQKRRAKGGNDIYQGLSQATQDPYDQLQMQPLPSMPPPPRR